MPRTAHRSGDGPVTGGRTKKLRAGQSAVGIEPAGNEHFSIEQQRGRVIAAHRVHRAGQSRLTGPGIVQLGGDEKSSGVADAAGEEHKAVGQQGSCVRIARGEESPGIYPRRGVRILNEEES